MRLIIFTNKDLSSNIMLNHLLPTLAPVTTHIFVSEKVGGQATELPQQQQLLQFLEQTAPIQQLFPLIDGQASPVSEPELRTFKGLSDHYNIPIEPLNDVRSAESLAKIRDLAPDLVLSVRYGKIFGQGFLNIPKYGVINFHSGLLPQYRGVLAIFRALMNGDAELKGTLHYIDDKTIDTGGIIDFSTLTVDPTKSLLWHIVQLYPTSAARVAHHVLAALKGEKRPFLSQNEAESAYFTFPTTTEWADFEAKGHRLVDWAWYNALLKAYTTAPPQ